MSQRQVKIRGVGVALGVEQHDLVEFACREAKPLVRRSDGRGASGVGARARAAAAVEVRTVERAGRGFVAQHDLPELGAVHTTDVHRETTVDVDPNVVVAAESQRFTTLELEEVAKLVVKL